jgi:hypothetical protein
MCDVKEFDRQKIRMLSVPNLETALTFIYNAEKKTIDAYNNK